MDLIVRNMDIPQNCHSCDMVQYNEETGEMWCNRIDDELVNKYTDSRPDACTISALPTPHGRLIDADAFEKKVKRLAESTDPYQKGIGKVILSALSETPTIIEAEVKR